MDAKTIEAIVDGGVGVVAVVAVCVLFFVLAKFMIGIFVKALREVTEKNERQSDKIISTLDDLARSINRMQNEPICKADNYLGKGNSAGRETKRKSQSRNGSND